MSTYHVYVYTLGAEINKKKAPADSASSGGLWTAGDTCLIPGDSRLRVENMRQNVVGIYRKELGEQLSWPAATVLGKAYVQSRVKHTPSLDTFFGALKRYHRGYDVLFTEGALYRTIYLFIYPLLLQGKDLPSWLCAGMCSLKNFFIGPFWGQCPGMCPSCLCSGRACGIEMSKWMEDGDIWPPRRLL